MLLGITANSPVLGTNGDAGFHDTEEAPNCRPFTVLDAIEEHGDGWACQEEDDGSEPDSHQDWNDKHIEEVDRDAWECVRWLDHLECPLDVILTLGRASLFAAYAFDIFGALRELEEHSVFLFKVSWDDDPEGHENANNNAELEDVLPSLIAFPLLIPLIKSGECKVGEKWLEADMDPAESCEQLVDWAAAVTNDKILNILEEFHKGKPIEASRNSQTAPLLHFPNSFSTEDPCSHNTGKQGETHGELLVEAHFKFYQSRFSIVI